MNDNIISKLGKAAVAIGCLIGISIAGAREARAGSWSFGSDQASGLT